MSSPARALVVLNPSAHGGAAARRFAAVGPIVESSFDARIIVGRPDGEWRSEIRDALDSGVRLFVAAGGDGTANAILDALIRAPGRPPLQALTLGAVGLGSSNDLHKPVRRQAHGIPLLLDAERAAPRDIVRCAYVDATGSHEVYVLVSASLGVPACANARFSERSRTATLLRRMSTTAAIAWAAARTVATWRNLSARLRIDDGAPERIALTSLSVLKTEWLSGGLRLGCSVDPGSGDFDVALVEGIGRAQLLTDVLALLYGRFDGRAGHRRCRARSLGAWLDEEMPLEFDGEVVRAREARFDVYAERIRLCG